MNPKNLRILPNRFAICRITNNSAIPNWALTASFIAITRTFDELSIVCEQDNLPDGLKAEKDWRLIKVDGPLDFSLTGILASIASPLAEAKISLFAISTFDTDYFLVKETMLEDAGRCLIAAGFSIR